MSIRDLFPGYFPISEIDIRDLWQDGIIVPDTNILLHLIRHNEKTRNELLSVLDRYRSQIWVPNQVALEFSRRWRDIDAESRRAYSKLRDKMTNQANAMKAEFDFVARHQTIDMKSIKDQIDEFVTGIAEQINDAEKRQIDDNAVLSVVDSLIGIVSESVGQSHADGVIDQWISEANIRFERSIPPGYVDFKDKNKKDMEKYGDFFIWKEMIAVSQAKCKGVLFVSDDAKEDWVAKIDGKEKGLKPELIAEFINKTNKKIHRYSFKRFLEWAQKHSNINISNATIDEVEKEVLFEREERRKAEQAVAPDPVSPSDVNMGLGQSHSAVSEAFRNLTGIGTGLGQSHSATSDAFKNLAGLDMGLGRSHSAASEAFKNLAGLDMALGRSHSAASEAFKNLAGLGTGLGQSHSATSEALKNLSGLGTGLGQSHSATSEALKNLSGLGTGLGQSHLAASEAFKNLTGIGTGLGQSHLAASEALKNLAEIGAGLGRSYSASGEALKLSTGISVNNDKAQSDEGSSNVDDEMEVDDRSEMGVGHQKSSDLEDRTLTDTEGEDPTAKK